MSHESFACCRQIYFRGMTFKKKRKKKKSISKYSENNLVQVVKFQVIWEIRIVKKRKKEQLLCINYKCVNRIMKIYEKCTSNEQSII